MANINVDQIKQAFDSFENDHFTQSKETIQKEIRKAVHSHLEDKLGLKNEIEPEKEKDVEIENDDDVEDSNNGDDE